ncbi:FAD:protein FMN transferase [Jongsikchunia kroppenstedtii]|uniref:FAD:protein FMN transferase n=1 Tax=Jongsikchunia kroppenstedtii TaxID=1121721 RepID=UPI00037170E0|nr:FAD:protein FMN transferase [Jongsikchunia kroppenstedtii]
MTEHIQIGNTALAVTDPAHADSARRIAGRVLDAVSAAADRHQPASEIARLNADAADSPLQRRISPILASILHAAIAAHHRTEGLVTPTVGGALTALGFGPDQPETLAAPGRRAARVPLPHLHRQDLAMVAGTALDLGAIAGPWAADTIARQIVAATGSGVLVGVDGNVAVAGPAPRGGWQVLVGDGMDGADPAGHPQPLARVALTGGGLATSSTIARNRQVQRGPRVTDVCDIIDPRMGAPVGRFFRTVSVTAPSCVAANTISLQAVVAGRPAISRLRRWGQTARLVQWDGSIVHTGRWPADSELSTPAPAHLHTHELKELA